jgi:hypothetical protein
MYVCMYVCVNVCVSECTMPMNLGLSSALAKICLTEKAGNSVYLCRKCVFVSQMYVCECLCMCVCMNYERMCADCLVHWQNFSSRRKLVILCICVAKVCLCRKCMCVNTCVCVYV